MKVQLAFICEYKRLHFTILPISPVNEERKLFAKLRATKSGVLSVDPVISESKLFVKSN